MQLIIWEDLVAGEPGAARLLLGMFNYRQRRAKNLMKVAASGQSVPASEAALFSAHC